MSDDDNPYDGDVLIAGAGPVGQVLALLLAQQGLRVIIVERWREPYPLPRAVALSHDALRVLRQVCPGEELSGLLEPWGQDGHRFSFEDSSGQTLAESQFALDSESGFAQMSGFSQPELEQLLERQLQADPRIELHRGWSLTNLVDDGSGVAAIVEPHTGLAPIPGGEPRTMHVGFAIGCDGANSTVRSLLGLKMTDLDFNRDWLVVDVLPHTYPTWLPYACQRLGPDRPTTLVPAGPGRRRWEFMILPSDEDAVVDTDETSWRLLQAWNIHPDNADLVRHARYTFRGRWSDQWRMGRVILAGDAAHQMPPFLGQGINSGIRDAANLSWRIALLVKGEGKDSLLDDYVAERSAQVAQIVRDTVAIGQFICMTDPDEIALRDTALKDIGSLGIQDAYKHWPLQGGTLRQDGIGGGLGLQACVDTGTVSALLDEVITPPGFVLLGRDRNPIELLSAGLRARWQQLGGKCAHFGPGGLQDIDGKYAAWFKQLDASVVVIRPDFHIFGGVHDPYATDGLVQDLTERILA